MSVRSGGRIVYKLVLDTPSYRDTSKAIRKRHFNSHAKNILYLVDIFQNAERGSSIYHFVGIYQYTHKSPPRKEEGFILFLFYHINRGTEMYVSYQIVRSKPVRRLYL